MLRFFDLRIRTECSEHVNSSIDMYWAHVRKKNAGKQHWFPVLRFFHTRDTVRSRTDAHWYTRFLAQSTSTWMYVEKSHSTGNQPLSLLPPYVFLLFNTPCIFFRLQFRLTNGVSITGTFDPTDTLSKVVSYVSSKRTDGAAPFSLSMTFPRKTFSELDMDKTLKDCGLVPSAVLMLTKLH